MKTKENRQAKDRQTDIPTHRQKGRQWQAGRQAGSQTGSHTGMEVRVLFFLPIAASVWPKPLHLACNQSLF